jgi:hypothetical protein
MPPQVVVVLVKNGPQYNTAVVPYTVPVPDGNNQTITWSAAGPNARFPSSNYFSWKTNPPPLGGTIPTRSSDGSELTLTYNNGFEGKWAYAIAVENSETSILIDPEIDNGPPR